MSVHTVFKNIFDLSKHYITIPHNFASKKFDKFKLLNYFNKNCTGNDIYTDMQENFTTS